MDAVSAFRPIQVRVADGSSLATVFEHDASVLGMKKVSDSVQKLGTLSGREQVIGTSNLARSRDLSGFRMQAGAYLSRSGLCYG